MRIYDAKDRYASHKGTAKRRNIQFNLTFEEWNKWWLSHGVDRNFPQDNSTKSLCMCRYNDSGPYELGNIYCSTRKENSRLARKLDPRAGTPKPRAIKTPLGIFEHIKAAAKAHNVSDVTIRNRLPGGKHSKPGYEFADDQYTSRVKIQTPFGLFDGLNEASKQLGIHYSTLKRRCVSNPKEYYYV